MFKNYDIIMGYSCNNTCKHCLRGGKNRTLEMSFKEVIDAITKAKENNVSRIVFQGGEPTIRKDFIDILMYAQKQGFEAIQIQSNGRMFSDMDFAKKSISYGITNFTISLHNYKKEEHDVFTDSEGSFEQTVEGIKNLLLLTSSKNIKILVVITKKNYKDLENIIKFLKSIGIVHIQIGIVYPYGSAMENFDEMIPKISDIKEYLFNAFHYLEKNNITFYTQDFPKCVLEHYENHAIEDNFTYSKKIYPDEGLIDGYEHRRSVKTVPEKCKSCKHFSKCEGFFTEYIKKFGDSEFNPVI